jgi:transcriptional regulator with XRE-family HTH domain
MGFYENYVALCRENGLKPQSAKIMKIANVGSSTITGWKKGAKPSTKPLLNLANYFGVSVEDLLATPKGESSCAEISNVKQGDNGTITTNIGDSDTDITNNYYTIHHTEQRKEVEVTKNSKRYFFSLLDNIRDMDDSQLLEMLKYSKYLLSKD